MFKGGLSVGRSDLEGLHTYMEPNRKMHASGKGWGQLSHSRVVSDFYCPGNNCVDTQLLGEVGAPGAPQFRVVFQWSGGIVFLLIGWFQMEL